MRFLFLDDDPKRQIKFKKMAEGHEIDFASDADAAISFLHASSIEKSYDAIFLDHDLVRTFQNSDEHNSGYQVVRYILDIYKGPRIPVIVLHSFNPDGAAKQLSKLIPGKVVACPFGYWRLETKAGLASVVIDI